MPQIVMSGRLIAARRKSNRHRNQRQESAPHSGLAGQTRWTELPPCGRTRVCRAKLRSFSNAQGSQYIFRCWMLSFSRNCQSNPDAEGAIGFRVPHKFIHGLTSTFPVAVVIKLNHPSRGNLVIQSFQANLYAPLNHERVQQGYLLNWSPRQRCPGTALSLDEGRAQRPGGQIGAALHPMRRNSFR